MADRARQKTYARSERSGRAAGVSRRCRIEKVTILRALLCRYSRKGRITLPSYATLQAHTGLARGSIRAGLKRLIASGLLTCVRRIVRKQVAHVSPITGLAESYVGTVQGADVYLLKLPKLLSIPLEGRKGCKRNLCSRETPNKEVFSSQWKEAGASATSYLSGLERRAKAGLTTIA